ncbi:hypothetical protein PP637_gp81 [Arthrobacter phage Persistence]|uniref:Uncharacterized protein n=1 Tax=Arthrobacter phage Persistence TaxID=2836007 RepID=A0A8F3E2C5_9CAUD|nr:hypothetical protein PP637_gp81 [Arthrobacter phage Persistence]QWY79709.1 hypothetical protein SEA_PERSISTENCE_81 [Arthrobacter phage Persistence]
MSQPRNHYTPGQALHPFLHAVGRPVTFFHGRLIEAGQVAKVTAQEDGSLRYDVRVISGGTFRDVALGDLNNPQPNTFTYAP